MHSSLRNSSPSGQAAVIFSEPFSMVTIGSRIAMTTVPLSVDWFPSFRACAPADIAYLHVHPEILSRSNSGLGFAESLWILVARYDSSDSMVRDLNSRSINIASKST
jgi:hypothetical protein